MGYGNNNRTQVGVKVGLSQILKFLKMMFNGVH